MRPDLTTIVKHLAAYRAYKGGQSVCSIAQQAGVGWYNLQMDSYSQRPLTC